MNCIGVMPVYFLKFRMNQLTLIPLDSAYCSMLMSLLSEEFEEGIVEENEDVFVEEMRTATGGAATLGELDNVDDEADSVADTDDILVRLAGTSEWTINTALFSQVSQLMSKVFPFTMT